MDIEFHDQNDAFFCYFPILGQDNTPPAWTQWPLPLFTYKPKRPLGLFWIKRWRTAFPTGASGLRRLTLPLHELRRRLATRLGTVHCRERCHIPPSSCGRTSLPAPRPEEEQPLPLTTPPARRDPRPTAATAEGQTAPSVSGVARAAACWELEFGARPSGAAPHSGHSLGLCPRSARGAEGSGCDNWRYCFKCAVCKRFLECCSWWLLYLCWVCLQNSSPEKQ